MTPEDDGFQEDSDASRRVSASSTTTPQDFFHKMNTQQPDPQARFHSSNDLTIASPKPSHFRRPFLLKPALGSVYDFNLSLNELRLPQQQTQKVAVTVSQTSQSEQLDTTAIDSEYRQVEKLLQPVLNGRSGE